MSIDGQPSSSIWTTQPICEMFLVRSLVEVPKPSRVVRWERVSFSSLHLVTRITIAIWSAQSDASSKLPELEARLYRSQCQGSGVSTVNRGISYASARLGSIHTFHFGSSAEFSQSTSHRCSIQQLDAVVPPSNLSQHSPTQRSTSTISKMAFPQ